MSMIIVNNKNIHLLIQTDNRIKEQVKTTKKMKATIMWRRGAKKSETVAAYVRWTISLLSNHVVVHFKPKISAGLLCTLL